MSFNDIHENKILAEISHFQLRCACDLIFFTTDLQTVNNLTQQFTARADLFIKPLIMLVAYRLYCVVTLTKRSDAHTTLEIFMVNRLNVLHVSCFRIP